MAACRGCGQKNRDAFKFCGECGASLVAEVSREERKVVTVVFTDLVDFTSKAERIDPEDVRRVLSPYYARVRSELQRFGGTELQKALAFFRSVGANRCVRKGEALLAASA